MSLATSYVIELSDLEGNIRIRDSKVFNFVLFLIFNCFSVDIFVYKIWPGCLTFGIEEYNKETDGEQCNI